MATPEADVTTMPIDQHTAQSTESVNSPQAVKAGPLEATAAIREKIAAPLPSPLLPNLEEKTLPTRVAEQSSECVKPSKNQEESHTAEANHQACTAGTCKEMGHY